MLPLQRLGATERQQPAAGDQHRIGPRHQLSDGLHGGGELGDGIAEAPVRPDVRVAELDERERIDRRRLRAQRLRGLRRLALH